VSATPRPLNVLLVAEEAAGIHVLRALAASPHRVVGVMTTPPTRGGGATVGTVAAGLGVPLEASERVRETATAAWVREHDVDLLLNVHSLFVVHSDVLAAPRIGSFNLHPGPLPEYAGLNAPSWAIYHREPRHGVTVHWMAPDVDSGPIAYESRFALEGDETGLSLSLRCVREGLGLVERLLEDAAHEPHAVPATAQELSKRRYFGREVPQEGRLEWDRPARDIGAFVRACDYFPFPSPWGHPVADAGGLRFRVVKATLAHEATSDPPGTVGRSDGGAVQVAAADEWVLVGRVEVDGAVREAADVLRAGVRLGDGA
jgi:methionyl-tRNA formyltransferase